MLHNINGEEVGAVCDDTLMARVAQGDEQAFAILVERHHGKLKALAWRVLFNDQAAEDAVQEAFCALWQSRDKWEIGGAAKLSTWLYRVTINKCVDAKRKQRPQIDIDDANMSVNAQADKIMNAKQMQKVLGDLLASLPEQQAMAMQLYYYEEKDIPQIAAEMDNTDDGVRSLIKRAKTSLRLHQSDLEIFR